MKEVFSLFFLITLSIVKYKFWLKNQCQEGKNSSYLYRIYFLVDGQWSLWSQWADCTVICGGGTARRYRFCTPSANGGEDCEGHGEELMECNNQTCPSEFNFIID